MSKFVRKFFALNDRFIDFVDDWKVKYYLLVGGYGSSKSYHVAVKLVKKLLQEKRTAMVVREVKDTHRDSTYSLLTKVAGAMGVLSKLKSTSSPMEIKFKNGSKIIFKGMDKVEKIKSLDDVSIIWIEECSEVKYAGFKELKGRLRHNDVSNHIILSTNPVSKTNWVYTHFFQDKRRKRKVLDDELLYEEKTIIHKGVYYHHSTVDDNYFVPEEYRQELEDYKEIDPDLYRIAKKGMFGTNGKKVFPQFEEWSHQKVMEAVRKIESPVFKNGMDFGFEVSYNALLRLVVDHKQKILYIVWEYYSRGLTDIEISNDIEQFKRTKELIKADCAEPKAIKFYKQQGFNMKACKKFKGSRNQYTKKVKRFKKIICSSNCPNTIDELGELTFKLDKFGEIIEDEFNIDPHTLSAIWYGLDDYEVSDLKGGSIRVLK